MSSVEVQATRQMVRVRWWCYPPLYLSFIRRPATLYERRGW